MRLLSGFVDTSGGFASLVLPLLKCLVTGIPRLVGSSRDLSAHSGGVAGLVLTCRIVLLYRVTESDRCVSGGGLFLR